MSIQSQKFQLHSSIITLKGNLRGNCIYYGHSSYKVNNASLWSPLYGYWTIDRHNNCIINYIEIQD